LRRNNWTRTSVKAGDQITITLAPAKNGAPVGFSGNQTGKVVFADGHVLKMDIR
jgi:prepilin-type processing-associated H-X9-DG protein